MNPSPQPLLAQFQARYPTASLIAELLTIHQGSYIVRAVVQMGNTLLATGMAAASDIEQAEDRAKVRALATLGIETFNPAPLQPPAPSAYSPLPFNSVLDQALDQAHLSEISPVASATDSSPVPPPEQAKSKDQAKSKALIQPTTATPLPVETVEAAQSSISAQFHSSEPVDLPPLFQEPIDATSSLPIEDEFTYSPDELDYSFPEDNTLLSAPLPLDSPLPETIPEIQPLSPAASPPAAKGKSTKRKSEPASTPSPVPASSSSPENDRSEEIAKIGVEMKRLGWTTDQGKNYLKRTYGKRSRQELSDDELLDFLRYLENQPSPTESLF